MTKERMQEITTNLMSAITGKKPDKTVKMGGAVTEYVMQTELGPHNILVTAGIVTNEDEAVDYLGRIVLGAALYAETGHTSFIGAIQNALKTGFAIGLLAGRKENAS